MALQHQTTQRSPAKEHFGYACKSPHSKQMPLMCFLKSNLFITPILQDPQMLDQLAKNITRCGLSNSTLNYLRVSLFRFQSVITAPQLHVQGLNMSLWFVSLSSLKLCVILEPMQELMSRHKTYSLSPRDCLKTCLFQKWQRMVAPPG